MARIGKSNRRSDETALWRTRRERLRLECRECEVICERCVSPWQCLRSGCKYIYSYDDGETTYFGCLQNVFLPELDLTAFSEGQGESGKGGSAGRRDPYGPIRVNRTPLPECSVTIEQAYEPGPGGGNCCNPTFFHEPAGPLEDTIRLTARRPEGDSAREGDSGCEDDFDPENDPDTRD